ncbi:hypothetical protein B0T20DRAFT_132690 [Sordaria brevicollis]|uniref:Uncharacterized protein n=1 Tax=Sordaria brevicollis TaxID=83679 RepID=A0AAE0PLJ5_SORBR|nr:hypothetical protein B0T20DRAFT_132690 [Sordaria brevicollis]
MEISPICTYLVYNNFLHYFFLCGQSSLPVMGRRKDAAGTWKMVLRDEEREEHEWPGYLGMDFHTLGGRRYCVVKRIPWAQHVGEHCDPTHFFFESLCNKQQQLGFWLSIPQLQRGAARPVKRMKRNERRWKVYFPDFLPRFS